MNFNISYKKNRVFNSFLLQIISVLKGFINCLRNSLPYLLLKQNAVAISRKAKDNRVYKFYRTIKRSG